MIKLRRLQLQIKFKKRLMVNNGDYEEISSSSSDEETTVSNDQFSELLFHLEQDLEELKKENEEDVLNKKIKKENQTLVESKKDVKKIGDASGDEGSEEDFLHYHLEELKKLKKISTLKSIKLKHINWFFDTALFNLMNELPEEFVIEPEEIYQRMLERFEITSKGKFHEHLKVLLEQKTKEKEFPFVRFFPVLNATKKRNSSVLDDSSSPETKRVKLPSPLSLENSSISFKSKV